MGEKRQDYITWDEYFMGVAELSARRSKDPNTQVGACIVSSDNKILSMGYNGFPRGCSDEEFPWGKEHEKDDPYNAKYEDTPSVRASKRMLNAAGVRYYRYTSTGREIKIQV